MSSNLIILCGTARSGKSTVARLLREAYTVRMEPCHEAPLGLLVKQELSWILGVPVADQEAQRASWRVVWQVWGTEVRRRLGGDHYWLRQWERSVGERRGHIIVPDVRFPNEIGFMAQYAQQHGMILRPVLVRRSLLWEAAQWFKKQRWHASERAWRPLASEFQWRIQNSGTLDNVGRQIERMMSSWR